MKKLLPILYLIVGLFAPDLYGQEAEILKSVRISSQETFGLDLTFQGVEQDEDGNYYMAYSALFGRDIYVNDLKIKNDTLPIGYQNDLQNDDLIVLMKFDPELNLDTIMKFKNTQWGQFEFDVEGDRIFVKAQFKHDMMINDEVFVKEEGDPWHIIWELDQDFNKVRDIKVDELNDYSIIELDYFGDHLYAKGYLDTMFHYNDTFIENYFYYDEYFGLIVYSQLTNFVVRYDMDSDSVMNAWRFGGTGQEHMLLGMVVDDYGNVIVTGNVETLKWFTFDDVDSIQTEGYLTGFLGKYTGNGNLIFGHLYNDALGVLNSRVDPDGEDLYVRAVFSGDTLTMASHVFDNTETNSEIPVFYKYNSHGEIVWANSLNGQWDYSTNRFLNTRGEKLYTSVNAQGNIEIEAQENTYIREKELNVMLEMDKNTGEFLSHHVTSADEDYNSNLFRYVDRNEEGNIVMLYQCVYEHELWGNVFDSYSKYGGDFYLMELDMELLTDIYDYESYPDMISISPNPVSVGSGFKVTISQNATGTWQLLSTSGQILKEGKVENSEIHIPTSSLSTGPYIVHYNDGIHMQNKIIMVQ
jgi:hypothetical protein